jgi:hypothetical protein
LIGVLWRSLSKEKFFINFHMEIRNVEIKLEEVVKGLVEVCGGKNS